jgi:hypothetical protein
MTIANFIVCLKSCLCFTQTALFNIADIFHLFIKRELKSLKFTREPKEALYRIESLL